MRKLVPRLVLPLTFLSYLLVDKWWYGDIADGPDVVAHGFPLISNAPSIDSSMEIVYFVPETIINISCYFIFWLVLVFIINRWVIGIWLPSVVAKVANGALLVWLFYFTWLSITYHTSFSWNHEQDMTILDSGFEWSWQDAPLPDYNKYHPAIEKPQQ
jgi:hypothetical protein